MELPSKIMLWLMVCMGAALLAGARAQPTTCRENEHCPTGFYCETDLHFCRECFRCEDLKREPPPVATTCIRSFVECGPCLKGLVADDQGDVGAGCVAADALGAQARALPAYMWAVIALSLLMFTAVVVALVYMLRNTDSFKILASTRASVQSPCSNGAGGQAAASAPQPPPPYNTLYAPVSYPPALPSPLPQDDVPSDTESSWPLVKRAPAAAARPAAAREAAGSQAARVYSNPAYVRGPHLPASYDVSSDEVPDNETAFQVHDEDTMESPWTPGDNSNGNDANANEVAGAATGAGASAAAGAEAGAGAGAGVGAGALQLPAARRASRSDLAPPPAKMLRSDTNNNRNRGGSSGGEHSGFLPPGAGAPSVVINVLNVNNVQQLNDVSL